ncbi:MAG: cyclase family protein [Sphingorhabdus sp.]
MTEFDRMARKVSNWGRWGKDDRRGTLNFITPDVLKGAAASIRQGKVLSLGLPFSADGPQFGSTPAIRKSPNLAPRFNPHLYVTALAMKFGTSPREFAFSDDVIHMPLQCATQWDGLSHVQYDDYFYNGVRASSTLTTCGCLDHGIEHLASPGITSRGVLLDLARLKGLDILPPNFVATPDDLEAAEKAQGIQVQSGDVLLIRTGHIAHFALHKDRDSFKGPQPGLGMECAEWLYEREVAAVCADNLAVEPLPGFDSNVLPIPLHMLCLRDMGCTFGEMFMLETLAEDCSRDGQYDFLLSAPALPVIGAVGSPVNPLVLK